LIDLIEKLTSAYGPSGREDGIRALIRSEVKRYCRNIRTDALGNLIAFMPSSVRKGNPERIMLCAHMDEIGLIVKHIDQKGFLRFAGIGGIFPERILSQRVVFENGVTGVIGPETKPETPKPLQLDNMYIDIGAGDRKEAERMVKIGDIAAFHQNAMLINNRLASKALDDRIGCYCLIEALKSLKRNRADIYFVFTTQEEVGLRGAKTSAYSIDPRYAVAVDVTGTGDVPESSRMAVSIGKGPAIKVKDSGFIAHPHIRDKLASYARRSRVPYQLEILERGSTDAAVIQLIREGVVSGVISIPTRYIHSPNEVCDLGDVKGAIRLLGQCAERGLA
jgi:endoglucanase